MAMSGRGRREAEHAIAACRPFKNSTGSFCGTRGGTRALGWLSGHRDRDRIQELLRRAVYVVWSYDTPIAFVTEDEDGERTAYYVDEQHSMTTSHHQGIVRCGLSEYETIGERRPARRPVRQVMPSLDFSDRRGMQYDSRVERDTSFERDMVEARQRAMAAVEPAGDTSGPDFVAPDQDTQRDTLARLLDPRYRDPDWTPFSIYRGHNLPDGADDRDRALVEREGTWRP